MNDSVTEKKIKDIIFKHIDPNSYQVFLFGSRAHGSPRQWSDYDVGVMGSKAVQTTVLADIADELEASDIPYIVEVVDFCTVDSVFKKHALEDAVLWN